MSTLLPAFLTSPSPSSVRARRLALLALITAGGLAYLRSRPPRKQRDSKLTGDSENGKKKEKGKVDAEFLRFAFHGPSNDPGLNPKLTRRRVLLAQTN
jgi:hypothetical protein